MKIIVALDSFKGSLTSMEAGNSVKRGILQVLPEAQVIVRPLADGGEGTTEAIVEGLGGSYVSLNVCGPLRKNVDAVYGMIPSTQTAVIEMASAAGIMLVGKNLDPMNATTYGVGEMIKDAVSKGCRKFIIGIGGSATNDGGIGMLTALGYRFTDRSGKIVGISGSALQDVCSVDSEHVISELKNCSFHVACDVTNPLCGPNGATYVYGPQKGVIKEKLADLDKAMGNFANVTAKYVGKDFSNHPGAGAAGGLGFALLSYLNADLMPGIDLVIQAVDLQKDMEGADLVFTGEGKLDGQTAMGKAPVGIAKIAHKYGAKVIALAGAIGQEADKCNEKGVHAFFPVVRSITTLDEAMEKENAKYNVQKTTEQIMRLITAMKE